MLQLQLQPTRRLADTLATPTCMFFLPMLNCWSEHLNIPTQTENIGAFFLFLVANTTHQLVDRHQTVSLCALFCGVVEQT